MSSQYLLGEPDDVLARPSRQIADNCGFDINAGFHLPRLYKWSGISAGMKPYIRSVPHYRFAQHLFKFGELFFHLLLRFGFEVQAEEGFGVGHSYVEPPVAVVDGDAV